MIPYELSYPFIKYHQLSCVWWNSSQKFIESYTRLAQVSRTGTLPLKNDVRGSKDSALFSLQKRARACIFSQISWRNQCKMNLESMGESVDGQEHGYVGSFVFLVHLVTLWFSTEWVWFITKLYRDKTITAVFKKLWKISSSFDA